jgi:hypothetical protein
VEIRDLWNHPLRQFVPSKEPIRPKRAKGDRYWWVSPEPEVTELMQSNPRRDKTTSNPQDFHFTGRKSVQKPLWQRPRYPQTYGLHRATHIGIEMQRMRMKFGEKRGT